MKKIPLWLKDLLAKTNAIALLSRLLLGGVFFYAGFVKLLHPMSFHETVANYHLLPAGLIQYVAIGLPILEIVLGGLLIYGIWVRFSSLLLSVFLIVFIAAVFSAILRGITISCGCFQAAPSSSTQLDQWLVIVRDLFLLVPGIYLIRKKLPS